MLDNLMEKETLPASPSEQTLPTTIANTDTHIKLLKENLLHLQQQIADAESDRVIMLKRAKELNITDDGAYKIIEVPVYPKKKVDVEMLKKLEPNRYEQILSNIRSRIQDKINGEMDKAEGFVSQADVKSVIRDKAVLARIIPEPKEPIGYEVNVVRR